MSATVIQAETIRSPLGEFFRARFAASGWRWRRAW